MHIPTAPTAALDILPFDRALEEYGQHAGGFDRDAWYYIPDTYGEYRYILGTRGARPLICVGINPSTAAPDALDPTLQSAQRIALANGYDSFLMFNVSPQRATDPNDMDAQPDPALAEENLVWLEAMLAQTRPVMWAAWGTLIEKRPYLPGMMRRMVAITQRYDIPWVTFGKRSKAGHPHHPLYLRKDETPQPFDVQAYLDEVFPGL